MLDDKEERIRSEAYRRWEEEGRPDGQHDRHWREAAEAISGHAGGTSVESEGTTQALKVPKLRAAPKPKAEKTVKSVKAEEEKAPKAVAAKVVASAGVASEPAKRGRARKPASSK